MYALVFIVLYVYMSVWHLGYVCFLSSSFHVYFVLPFIKLTASIEWISQKFMLLLFIIQYMWLLVVFCYTVFFYNNSGYYLHKKHCSIHCIIDWFQFNFCRKKRVVPNRIFIYLLISSVVWRKHSYLQIIG